MIYIFPFTTAFVIAVILTPFVRRIALKLRIIDKPGPRKIHAKPTALLGGLAIYLSFVFSTALFWSFGYIHDLKISDIQISAVLLGGLVLMMGGFLDDKYNLKPIQQIFFPISAILIVLAAGIKISFFTNPFGGIISVSAIIGPILAFFWLLGMIYTTKFLDGLDGLVSGITAIGSLIIFIVSLSWDIELSGTSFMSLILAGSALGFLLYNWHPAKIFLGEGGSVFCGFMLGILSIISGSKIATALLIMGIPILDILWVIIRRLYQGRSPVQADRKHLHFRLLDVGLSQPQSVLFLYILTGAFGLTSLFLHSAGKLIALGLLGLFMIFLASCLIIFYKFKTDHEAN